jgi:hypothetical protein
VIVEPYLVIVILQPTKKQKDDEGAVATIVVQPTAVMAKDDAQAAMKAFRLVPEEHAANEDRLDVRVLAFRSAAR